MRMGIRLASALLLLWPVLPASAGLWPDDASALVASFAAPSPEGFTRSLVFRSEGQRVTSWNAGEVLWIERSGGGDTLVLDHDDGFRSVYRGIEVRPDLSGSVSAGEMIGYAAGSDWRFEIVDDERDSIIDPLTLLPPRSGLAAPRVERLLVVLGSDRRVVGDGSPIPSGRRDIIVELSGGEAGTGVPVEISLYWVGVRVGGIRFDALSEDGGAVILEAPDPRRFDQVYGDDGALRFPGVMLNAGRGNLELRVEDETGRVVSRTWSVTVSSGS